MNKEKEIKKLLDKKVKERQEMIKEIGGNKNGCKNIQQKHERVQKSNEKFKCKTK